MRLYTLQGRASVQHDDFGTFDVDPETGAVEVPEPLGRQLHALHIGGKREWETDAERTARIAAEDLARRQDPASLYDLIQQRLSSDDAAEPEDVDALKARIAELEAEVEALKAAAKPEETKPDASAEPTKATKPRTPARKRTGAKPPASAGR